MKYAHVWDDGNRTEGCIRGLVNNKWVEFTIRHDTGLKEMPTNQPVYNSAEYLGVLDSHTNLDYSSSFPTDSEC